MPARLSVYYVQQASIYWLETLQRAVSLVESLQNLSIDKKSNPTTVTPLKSPLGLPLPWNLPNYAPWYQSSLKGNQPTTTRTEPSLAKKSVKSPPKAVKKTNSSTLTKAVAATSPQPKAPLKIAIKNKSKVEPPVAASKLKAQPLKNMPNTVRVPAPAKTPVKALNSAKKVENSVKIAGVKPVQIAKSTQPKGQKSVMPATQTQQKKQAVASTTSTAKPAVKTPKSKVSLPKSLSAKTAPNKAIAVAKKTALPMGKPKINAKKSVENAQTPQLSQPSLADMTDNVPKTSWIPVSKPSRLGKSGKR